MVRQGRRGQRGAPQVGGVPRLGGGHLPGGLAIRCLLAAGLIGGVLASAQVNASTNAPVIQPGSRITMGGEGCTANWVYLGLGRLRGQQFIGTAKHCVSRVGEPVYLAAGPFPVSFAPGLRIGTVAYISRASDFSLIRITRSNFRYVVASMAGHPDIPRRVGGTRDAKVGDVCQFSGHGVGFDGLPETEQSRVGLLTYISRDQLYCDGPASNGDSGGPVADITDGNAAIGVLDAFNIDVGGSTANAGVNGVALTEVLADAAGHGFPIRLRTVG